MESLSRIPMRRPEFSWDPILADGHRKRVGIIEPAGILVDWDDIMLLVAQPACHARPGALIHQKSHADRFLRLAPRRFAVRSEQPSAALWSAWSAAERRSSAR